MQTLIEPKQRKQSPSRISVQQYNLILELKGLPHLTIAKRAGVSPPTVRNIFKKQQGFMEPLHEQVAEKYNRDGENDLTAVEDLDFSNNGNFCIKKWGEHHAITSYTNKYKSKTYATNAN